MRLPIKVKNTNNRSMAEIGLSRNDAFMILNALPRIGWITLKKLLDFVNQDPVKLLSISQADLETWAFPKSLVPH